MEELLETLTTTDASNDTFRVWLTTEPHNRFPITLLQVCYCEISILSLRVIQIKMAQILLWKDGKHNRAFWSSRSCVAKSYAIIVKILTIIIKIIW